MKSFNFKGYPSEIQSKSFNMNLDFEPKGLKRIIYFGHFCIDCKFEVYFVGGQANVKNNT